MRKLACLLLMICAADAYATDCNSNGTDDATEKYTCGCTEWLSAASLIVEEDATAPWTNPNNMLALDGLCGQTTLSNEGAKSVRFYAFNPGIPSAATNGIRWQVGLFAHTLTSASNVIIDNGAAYGAKISTSGGIISRNAWNEGTTSPAAWQATGCSSFVRSITTDLVNGDFGALDANSAPYFGYLTRAEANSNGTFLNLDFGCSATDTFYFDCVQIKYNWDVRDCNTNNIPDYTETGFRDCNTNNTMDFCEFRDCNTDCTNDATQGTLDANSNGRPDACDRAFLNTAVARPSGRRPSSR